MQVQFYKLNQKCYENYRNVIPVNQLNLHSNIAQSLKYTILWP